MAGNNAVWGIDIGQCALKALQCRPHEKDPGKIVGRVVSTISNTPKILSQPEADPEELVREALVDIPGAQRSDGRSRGDFGRWPERLGTLH